jgi:4'-phosphopantetheinyl transferase
VSPVDIWCFSIAAPLAGEPELHALLDEAEQGRAARFIAAEHRGRFVRGHGLVRLILARYLDRPARALRFGTAGHGKPFLLNTEDLSFNLSHSHELAALAVARGLTLGVDVEHCRPLSDRDGLVRRFFSAREQALFAALPEAERQAGFFRLWTRKEAYIKALGEGLSCPLDSFAVSADDEARILEPLLAGWSLRHFDPAPGYVGALAVAHPAPVLRFPAIEEALTAALPLATS